jgi:hypothetical protein
MTSTAYALNYDLSYDHGNASLQRFSLVSHQVLRGPTFRVADLSFNGGYLWVFGTQTARGSPLGPVLCQVSPTTLHLIRQVRLRLPPMTYAFPMSIANGPGASIWVGIGASLERVDTKSGRIAERTKLPSGNIVSISTDPSERALYVSLAYPTVDGVKVDQQVDELNAVTGHFVVGTGAKSAVVESVAGGEVVALPDGVADSFRTGMAGATILLHTPELVPVTPPGTGNGDSSFTSPPGDVFSWFMDTSTIYGAGALWVETEAGVVACVDPGTGEVRAIEQQSTNPPAALYGQLLAVDPRSKLIFSAIDGRLVEIAAPATCWRSS